jgi:hypothetical protein
VTVNLIETQSQFEDRIIQLDLRLNRAFPIWDAGCRRAPAIIQVTWQLLRSAIPGGEEFKSKAGSRG